MEDEEICWTIAWLQKWGNWNESNSSETIIK